MQQIFRLLLLSALLLSLPGTALAQDISLPAPKSAGGPDVLTAISQRASASGSSFPMGEVSREELATLLWAATGKNRDKGWTVPMAMGEQPYCTVYVALPSGSFRFDWNRNVLVQVGTADIRADLGTQGFAQKAPVTLVFVEEAAKMSRFKGERRATFGPVAIGAMTQNAYLAAQAMGLGVRYVATLDPDLARKHFQLKAEDRPLAAMPMGKF